MTEGKCFIIMPISTPEDFVEKYNGEANHFSNVLNHLFIPAVKKAGFEPIPPKTKGSKLIQADIIGKLSKCEHVLCDMSILNPNVFFELGIRTALNKPVTMVVDDDTKDRLPFDTSIINYHSYKTIPTWRELEKEVEALAQHIKDTHKEGKNRNALWKHFGVAQTGEFKPEESTQEEKMDLVLKEIAVLKEKVDSFKDTSQDFSNIHSAKSLMEEYRSQASLGALLKMMLRNAEKKC